MIILLLISAFANAIMDYLQFHYYKNNKFWNPKLSWKNKYKNNDKRQGEKFPFSTTILVSFTDGWHLMQNVFLSTLFIFAILFEAKHFFGNQTLNFIANFVIYKSIFTGIKQISLWILKYKK
jgi:hypothetical protein